MSATVVKECTKRALREVRDAGDVQWTDERINRFADDLCDMLVDKMGGQTFRVPTRTARSKRVLDGRIEDMYGGGNSVRYIKRALRIGHRRLCSKTR